MKSQDGKVIMTKSSAPCGKPSSKKMDQMVYKMIESNMGKDGYKPFMWTCPIPQVSQLQFDIVLFSVCVLGKVYYKFAFKGNGISIHGSIISHYTRIV